MCAIEKAIVWQRRENRLNGNVVLIVTLTIMFWSICFVAFRRFESSMPTLSGLERKIILNDVNICHKQFNRNTTHTPSDQCIQTTIFLEVIQITEMKPIME